VGVVGNDPQDHLDGKSSLDNDRRKLRGIVAHRCIGCVKLDDSHKGVGEGDCFPCIVRVEEVTPLGEEDDDVKMGIVVSG
jgi:hypothetical protein